MMKTKNGLSVLLGVAIALAFSGAWAQGSAPASSGEAVAASGGATGKATRQANRALRRKVYAALAGHKEIDAGDIGITAKGGAVMISGTVPEASQITTVTEVVKSVPGVTSVSSKLTLQRPFGQ